MAYHLRNAKTLVPYDDQQNPNAECPDRFNDFAVAMAHAHVISGLEEEAILICRDSGTVDWPAFTPIASVENLI